MKLYQLLYLFPFILLCSSCEIFGIANDPSSDKLPPITTEGKNTFGCLLNGEVWNRCGGFLETSSLLGEYHDFHKIFQLQASRDCDGFDDSIFISADVTNGMGKYELHSSTNYDDLNSDCHSAWNPYELLEDADNWVEILHLDLHEAIVSGTFQCTLVHPDCGDTLYITDGRFDYQWAV